MVLAVGRLHQITTQIVIESWKAASIGVAPGIALNRSQPLCGELSRDGVYAHLRIDQDMRGIGQDLLSPAIEWQGTLDKTIAKGGCHLCLAILLVSGVIAQCSEPLRIHLAAPALDRNLPIDMPREK